MKLKHAAIGLIVFTTTGYIFYEKILSDEAKSKIEELAQTLQAGYSQISEVVDQLTGQVVDDPETLPNVQVTQAQWNSLGY